MNELPQSHEQGDTISRGSVEGAIGRILHATAMKMKGDSDLGAFTVNSGGREKLHTQTQRELVGEVDEDKFRALAQELGATLNEDGKSFSMPISDTMQQLGVEENKRIYDENLKDQSVERHFEPDPYDVSLDRHRGNIRSIGYDFEIHGVLDAGKMYVGLVRKQN